MNNSNNRNKQKSVPPSISSLGSDEPKPDLVSSLSEKTAQPFSAFKTPYLSASRWNHIDKLGDVFGVRFFASNKKHGFEDFAEKGVWDTYDNYYDPYPAWGPDEEVPITRGRIQSIFIHLSKIFGFQYDNTKNMFDYLMRLLDSRASRMGSAMALRSLHADYIGGVNSNYRKWYFGSQMDIEDNLLNEKNELKKDNKKKFSVKNYPLTESEMRWVNTINSFLPEDCVIQLAIYLLIWGEANNIRFIPECLCFLFKSCIDTFYSLDFTNEIQTLTPSFIDHAITPLYNYYRDQLYEKMDGHWVIRDRDHASIIGYDDINQTFWYRKSLEKIELYNKQKIIDFAPHERYLYLNQINWKKSISKTYYEYRSWFHVLINFNRIWNIHVGVFWYYTCFNCPTLYTQNYAISVNNSPTLTATLFALSLAGPLVSFINLISINLELIFVPRSWPGATPFFSRFVFILLLFLVNAIPSLYVFFFAGINDTSVLTFGVTMFQFIFSLFTVGYLSVTPLAYLTGTPHTTGNRRFLPSMYFTNFVYSLKGKSALASYGLWSGVFVSKFTESYFFLTLSLRDPVRELSVMKIRNCVGEEYFGSLFCEQEPKIILILMILTDLVLFFLDTYLWYIIWNTGFSVANSFYRGVSIWTPWRNMFVRLPQRIMSKILSSRTVVNSSEISRNNMICKIWNSIIISMYRDHLIAIDHLESLIYQRSVNEFKKEIITEPSFFIEQEDGDNASSSYKYLNSDSEAARRLSFFAHSLSTPIPKPTTLEEMPVFSVLIPHYSEKITLSLQEVIRREDEFSNITVLEYLKHLYPEEWQNFVRDTKLLAAENITYDEKRGKLESDLPFYAVGFKSATPEYVLRTRIWASLRSQTLFRTISGFMNYSRALKLLYSVECDDHDENVSDIVNMEQANVMAQRKFRLVTSLQKMKEFTPEQEQAKEFLLRTYPELQIAYLDVEIDPETNDYIYYSALIDGNSDIMANGERKPKYRIRLSGKPILGDGKSDNQNHAIIFCRGEYVQLVDANQDNYIEECLKIRSVLNEFEEYYTPDDPYTNNTISEEYSHPVAIVGTREYIFSENVGVLGDVSAGKEQTFGTLFARTLAQVGGKLHYGHPDFLNTVFMTTRGGVSKSQRGLHLNEDIYAGMNAIMRGARIKHCEYFQCGKGRDLGFSSILNFTTKIGSGMSEQLLSREYFYLGTQLQLDRFLSFFYAHPGFHLNNVFILLSLKMFVLFCIHLAALTNDTVLCTYDKNVPFTDTRYPVGCFNLIPVIDWVQRCVLSIFIVFAISFIPLCSQELMERGIWRCIYRSFRHFTSLSPMFEVFVCRVYSQSLVNDLAVGGAKYIATGRGFSTSRTSFTQLYARFSNESFYFAGNMLMLLLYCSLVMWKFSLLYFWATFISLFFSPFWFNPNQFNFKEFFLDYKNLLRWLSSGNVRPRKDSWISHIRSSRMIYTGSKIKTSRKETTFMGSKDKRPSFTASFISQTSSKLATTIIIILAYLFSNSQNESNSTNPTNAVLRLLIISFGPILVNATVLLILFFVSIFTGPIFMCCSQSFPGMIANFAHLISVISQLLFFEFLLLCQNWNISKSILGACAAFNVQDLFFKLITILLLNRELKNDKSNKSWWTGLWVASGLGWHILTQPFREYVCKIIEMSNFATDFLMAHLILVFQFPILFIPYIDTIHSVLLLWLRPENMLRKPIYSASKRHMRNRITIAYFLLFLFIILLIVSVIAIPIILARIFEVDFDLYVPEFISVLFQPLEIVKKRKGLKNYIVPKHNQ